MFKTNDERAKYLIDEYVKGRTLKELAAEVQLSLGMVGMVVRSERERAITRHIALLVNAAKENDPQAIADNTDAIFTLSTLRNNKG